MFSTITRPKLAIGEFIPKRVHLGDGVLVAGAVGGRDSVMQACKGGRWLSVGGHRLSGHLVSGNVVRVVRDAAGELSKPFRDSTLRDELHGESVASKGIGRGLLQDLVEQRELVHTSILVVSPGRLEMARKLDA